MNICLRNFKILNALYTIKLSHQQCALRLLSAITSQHHQSNGNRINNGHCHHSGVNNSSDVSTVNYTRNIHCAKLGQIREYCNVSSKQADSEQKLKRNNEDKKDDKKPLPESEQSDKRTLPRLMNFPEIMWPSMLNSIKNWIMVHFIIRPYMDREFNLRDFAMGAKKAMWVCTYYVEIASEDKSNASIPKTLVFSYGFVSLKRYNFHWLAKDGFKCKSVENKEFPYSLCKI